LGGLFLELFRVTFGETGIKTSIRTEDLPAILDPEVFRNELSVGKVVVLPDGYLLQELHSELP
jgi:hypothetical protein